MKTNYQLQNMAAASQDQAFVDESARIAVPYTQIVGRASIPDLANDFRASLGIERIPVQQIMLLQNEFGPEGQPVYSALNDTRGLIRFVGAGWINFQGVYGQFAYTTTVGDYFELTVYGTGLNFLTQINTDARDASVTIDGSLIRASGVYPGATSSFILGNRNYNPNQVLPLTTTSLSLGLHTIKVTCLSNNLNTMGFEILNANASGLVNINPGSGYYRGKKFKNTAADSILYSTGVTGTKGGRIVRYFTDTDTMAEAFQAVDASIAYLTNANHANEEVARTYHWREFGAGRSDDFSLLATSPAVDRAFTLEDGVTTLVGYQVLTVSPATGFPENLSPVANNSYVTLTFVGTGLDILRNDAGGPAVAGSYALYVDGISRGNLSNSGSPTPRIEKLCSGLPYGTHTVKIFATSVVIYNFGIHQFIVYQPKKPSLPAGAVEVADYNVMATFDGTTATGTTSADNIQMPVGVLSKMCSREFVYVGAGWLTSAMSPLNLGGIFIYTSNNSQPFQYTFSGTGISLLLQTSGSTAYDFTVTIDGALNATGVARANASNLTGGSYRSTAVGSTQPVRVEFTGLSMGAHTIVVTCTSGAVLIVQALHIITPIHTHKSNLYADLQNTLPVGSQSLMDSRSVSPQPAALSAPKAWAQAVGVTSGPTTTASMTSPVPLPDLSCTIKTSGGNLDIRFFTQLYTSGSSGYEMRCFAYVNGVAVNPLMQGSNLAAGNGGILMSGSWLVPVAPGIHKVDIYWGIQSGGGTLTATGTNRILTVIER